jgi:hypothetical protein
MNTVINFIALGLGMFIVPAVFFVWCGWMAMCKVRWLCYPAYFVLFGIVGGACIAVALSPSGLAALCILFVIGAGTIGCLLFAILLTALSDRGRFENIAMIACYAFPALIGGMFVIAQLTAKY